MVASQSKAIGKSNRVGCIIRGISIVSRIRGKKQSIVAIKSIKAVASYVASRAVQSVAVACHSIRFGACIFGGLRCNNWRRLHLLHIVLGRCLTTVVVLFINLLLLGSLEYR
jgi:hypothetical protein